MNPVKLSVIIPIYNEEGNISLLYERLCKSLEFFKGSREFVFINDGSKDNSIFMIQELSKTDSEVKYINLSRNFGHQIAVTAGLEHCNGERIAIIDADLQDPPELILDMNQKMDEGFDVVYAKRKKRANESLFKLFTAKMFYRLLAKITSVAIPVDTGDFRIFSRRVLEVVKSMPEQNKFLRGQIAWIGFQQTFIEYDRDERHAGVTGYPFKKMLKFALDGITSFSEFPLKLATISGFVVSFFSFFLILYSLYSRFITQDYEPGWTSIMISVLFIGGIQLFCIGIIGEYIGRIATDSRKRPLYIIDKKNI